MAAAAVVLLVMVEAVVAGRASDPAAAVVPAVAALLEVELVEAEFWFQFIFWSWDFLPNTVSTNQRKELQKIDSRLRFSMTPTMKTMKKSLANILNFLCQNF